MDRVGAERRQQKDGQHPARGCSEKEGSKEEDEQY